MDNWVRNVSTIDQSVDLQLDVLNEFGCYEIFKEKVSGAKDDREDRLARSTKKQLKLLMILEKRK
ncbi:hypothetical protein [Metabacillus sediminilitoris]|uniref:hypothetical protein n=1 Tax=Metabacillus sediminilitoris TaxID=2567941 RepID=UPI001D0D952A|nr:hypothetical protein [Metabacillus sediminilitoris]